MSPLNLQTTAIQAPVTSTDALSKSAKQAKEDAKIDKSAHDFEAVLLGNWLQSAQETFSRVPGGEEDDQEEQDGATSQFTQMAMQSLGNSFAASGGIGIAKMISAQLHKTQDGLEQAAISAQKPEAPSSPTNFSLKH